MVKKTGEGDSRFRAKRLVRQMTMASWPWIGSARGGILAAACALVLLFGGAAAAAPAPAEAPSAASTAPAVPAAPTETAPPADAPPPPPGLSTPAQPTLVPPPANAGDVDEVALPGKPAAITGGRAQWDDAVKTLKEAFGKLRTFLDGAGVKIVGRPVVLFLETDDTGFRYDALLPVETAPAAGAAPPPEGIRFGTTPSGKALRFVHKGPYDEIDSTYEAITAYLDAKTITVRDMFIEEYATDLTSGDDAALEVYIYVQPAESGAAPPAAPPGDAPPPASVPPAAAPAEPGAEAPKAPEGGGPQ